MRTVLLVLAAWGLVVPGAHAGQSGKVEKEIVALERDSCEIQLKKDWARFEPILAADFINVSPGGATSTKSQLMAALPGFDVSSCHIEVNQVIVHGGTAIAVGRMEMASTYHAGPFRFLDTFLRRDGRWQLQASAQTAISP